MFYKVFLIIVGIGFVCGNQIILYSQDYEDDKSTLIRNIYDLSDDKKGWINFLVIGTWSDVFYKKMQGIPLTFLVFNEKYTRFTVDDNLRYRVNTLVIDCENFIDFEKKLNIVRNIPHWHPHSNMILIYQNSKETNEIIARIFFALWYYNVPNAIILQFDDTTKNWMMTYFNPYVSENYKLEHNYGCWTRKKLTFVVKELQKDIICTKECHNVTLHSKFRAQHLGTCMGFKRITLRYDDRTNIKEINLFDDKAKNMHGFPLRAYGSEVLPFFLIDENEDGTYTLRERDGFIWNAIAEVMNFTIDLSPVVNTMKLTFDFELSIQQIYDFSKRMGDLVLLPIYQFDLIIVEIDMTFAFKDSGICFLSHRAGFETTLFDVKLFQTNYAVVIEFLFCFLAVWFVFFVFNIIEKDAISCDQAGKDLINAFRNILSISLYKPPKKETFKLFLFVSIWSFFIINFATQAAIISFFSAFKRGKDVETFDDVIEKGYIIEGMASPDIMLPESDEKFRKINAKLVPVRDLFGCVKHMTNDSHRFCLIDCSVGRYLVRNRLNAKGEQYLHVSKDQIHSNYLNMILPKDSPLTDTFNRNMHIFFQAGLINKWEQYRFADIKYEAPVKSLDMDDLGGIFKCYILMVGFSIAIFLIEIFLGIKRERRIMISKMVKRKIPSDA